MTPVEMWHLKSRFNLILKSMNIECILVGILVSSYEYLCYACVIILTVLHVHTISWYAKQIYGTFLP